MYESSLDHLFLNRNAHVIGHCHIDVMYSLSRFWVAARQGRLSVTRFNRKRMSRRNAVG